MKKILFSLIVISALLISNSLIHSIISLWQKQDLLDHATRELEHQKQENVRLKTELSYVNTPDYVEKQARDKLLMTKPGEERLMLPEAPSNESSQVRKGISDGEPMPTWQQWWNLFF